MILTQDQSVQTQTNKSKELFLFKVKVLHTQNPYSFQIEMPISSSLNELHETILKAVDFDNDHLFEFFAGKNERDQSIHYGMEDKSLESFDNFNFEEILKTYNQTFVEDVYPLPEKCKLYYLFDFGDCWTFEITKSAKKPEYLSKVKYPRVFASKGVKPEQYPEY